MILGKSKFIFFNVAVFCLVTTTAILIWTIFFIKSNVSFNFIGLVQDYVSEYELVAPIDGVVSFSGISGERTVDRFERLVSISSPSELAREDALQLSYDNLNQRLQCVETLHEISTSYGLSVDEFFLESLERQWEELVLPAASFCSNLMSEFLVSAEQFSASARSVSIMRDRLSAFQERLLLEERNEELVRQAWLNLLQLADQGLVSASAVNQAELELNEILARIVTVRTNILDLDSEIVATEASRDLLVARWLAQIDATRSELASTREDVRQQLNIQAARNSLGDIYAPLSGYLIAEDEIFSGQTVLRGQKLAVIRANVDTWVVVAEVPLDRLVSVDLGTRVNIQWSSGVSETLRRATGQVISTEINPSARGGGMPTVVSIVVEINEQELAELPDRLLRNGVSVQLSVVELNRLWHFLQ